MESLSWFLTVNISSSKEIKFKYWSNTYWEIKRNNANKISEFMSTLISTGTYSLHQVVTDKHRFGACSFSISQKSLIFKTLFNIFHDLKLIGWLKRMLSLSFPVNLLRLFVPDGHTFKNPDICNKRQVCQTSANFKPCICLTIKNNNTKHF